MTMRDSICGTRGLRFAMPLLAAIALPALAQEFELGDFSGALKTRVSQGAAWRVETRDSRFVGKLNLNPNLCPDGCLSFTGDPGPNQRLVAAPGGFFGSQKDDGDLNYRQGAVVNAVTKVSSELTGSYSNFTFKLGGTAFYDPINFMKRDRHPDTTFQPNLTARREDVAFSTGAALQLKDAFVSGKFKLFEQDFSATLGYQHIRWGESNFVAINSLNEWNSPDERLLHQPGTPINEVFRPVPAFTLNIPLPNSFALDLIYQLAWVPVKTDADGTFFGNVDIINSSTALLSLGQFHEDPNRRQRLPTAGGVISSSSLTIEALGDGYAHPSDNGQFGGKLSYYAAELNGGTELGFYAMNYHSRLPYLSFIASDASCAQGSGGSFLNAFLQCNGFRANTMGGLEPLPLDTAKVFFDYPEDIQLYGMSFNTNLGKWSLAGEMSYRPNLPVQVQVPDLLFAAIQPAFPDQDLRVDASLATNASVATIIANPPSPGEGTALVNIIAASAPLIAASPTGTLTVPSNRSAVPDNISSYRHYTVQPHQVIRGYERLQTMQFDATGIRALGSSDNPVGADQVILLVEGGLTWYMDMPSKRLVQFEANNAHDSHYSGGADGSHGGNPETLNPTFQGGGFATPVSMGYRVLARLEYDDVLGVNLKPMLMWSHDVYGNVGYQQNNFFAGTKTYVVGTEIEAGLQWSGQIFYQGSTGGFSINNLRDRDLIALSVAYQF